MADFACTAPSILGPWTECNPVLLEGLTGEHVAAPGVFFEPAEGVFHMFVQTEFMRLGGAIEHLVSYDARVFRKVGTCLASISHTVEAGIYDPHPATVPGRSFLTYSANTRAGRPDLFLATSDDGWHGPWRRVGPILRHAEVWHHNQHDHADYEWGLEGSQLLALPGGLFLLNAVCFLPTGARGTRQRVFFAVARSIEGPYRTLGPLLEPATGGMWESGENGHATAVLDGPMLRLFYQARAMDAADNAWRYGLANVSVNELCAAAETVLASAVASARDSSEKVLGGVPSQAEIRTL